MTVTAQVVAIFLAGLFAPLIIQIFKGGKIKGSPALWLTFIVSFVLAGIAEWLTGGLKAAINIGDPIAAMDAVKEAFLVIFALSQVVYKFFWDKIEDGLQSLVKRVVGKAK